MSESTNTRPTPSPVGDPLADPRLQRLAARSAAARARSAGVAAPSAPSAPSDFGPPVQAASRSVPPTSRTNASGAPAGAARKPRRRHAARGSRSAALALSATSTLGLAAYFQHADASAATGTQAVAVTATAAAVATTAAPAAATSIGLADGTFAGATFTNKWGPVQVQITVSGGVITDVTALQTPTDDRKSISINNRAVPVLTSSALSAQSAAIDTVSGATYTSVGYKQSLQSAIDTATAASIS